MIIEDSLAVRTCLEDVINHDPRLEVVASLSTAEEAMAMLSKVSPDIISMDIHLPGMDGLQATTRIMESRPTPIIIVSGTIRCDETHASMNALRAGALSIMEKPTGPTSEAYAIFAERLCTQLAIMSQVKVVRQRFNVVPRSGARRATDQRTALREGRLPPSPFRMLGIVASTGGPRALLKVLGSLPANFPLPIALVQHITPSFHDGFVDWLDANVPIKVVSAEHGQRYEPSVVYVAPPDRHLAVNRDRLILTTTEPVCGQRPAGDVLLASLADAFAGSSVGVVLTGMGCDGATGLAEIRRAGGYTIAEDESTAVVFGMPAAAVEKNAVWETLPLTDIGDRLTQLTSCIEGVL
ncbi:MAG: chemotaxis-specific protein-glutamate methyltransferase CheB [Phycisphaera sp. RhM]|nr:chemotaxis-specific protein-glutamate methyltransferase CheB [Phycisphaera sp. RhM]